ncbi:VOC family protein [Rosenbergiella sp. S61]|uniref:VOC family protein n=1 Tax=Rosenbergiella gaditana TaxID=2726987 RepID=A0ABS5SW68_9GAMM|nr:VOC family protein [Rosenbergiella gaditana]MBT0724360.1 VOC family protein [Rosenbergiella gaditana]
MLNLNRIHHIAIIASDYLKSRHFYCEVLGFQLLNETYRVERQSWKADLALCGEYVIELFSFPNAPPRMSYPEACGLRHLAFAVENLEQAIAFLKTHHVECEPIRIDSITDKAFTFFSDPDGLPLEFYQDGTGDGE